jgi:hypothetical protein
MIGVVIEDSITYVSMIVIGQRQFRRIEIVALFSTWKFIFDESKLDFDSTVNFVLL